MLSYLIEPSQLSLQQTVSGMTRKSERQSVLEQESLGTLRRTFDEIEEVDECK